jgi:hypothetical protein
MRYLFGFVCLLALAVMGCSETSGTGGSGGSAGSGGTGGDGVPIKSGLWLGGNPASNADGTPFDTGWAICFDVNEDGTALALSTDCDIDEDDDEAYFLEISWKEDVGKNGSGEPCSDGVGVGTSFVNSGFESPTLAIENNSFEIRGSAAAGEGLWIVEGTFDGDVATGTAIWALPLGMGIPFCELEGEWTASAPVCSSASGGCL